jgi:hypothetical protein
MIVALALAPVPRPDSLECSLQTGAAWNEGSSEVSAVVCNGKAGFFVPSSLYRTLRDPTKARAYQLLERELELADKEIGSLRRANESLDFALKAVRRSSDRFERSWREAEEDARQARQDAREATHDSWLGDILWFLGGAGVVALSVLAVSEMVPDRILNPE